MIELVISGGQSGADLAGWRAAKLAGLSTGGFMPLGYLTEDGPRPEYRDLYGAVEHPSPLYPPRTRANIAWADATLIFASDPDSRGTKLAAAYAEKQGKPCVVVVVSPGPIDPRRPAKAAEWLRENGVKTLNVAGNRASKSPGIGPWVESYLADVFKLLMEPDSCPTTPKSS